MQNYTLSRSEIALCWATGLSGLPYAKRHWDASNTPFISTSACFGHRLIMAFEAIPVIGGLIAIIDRIIAICCRSSISNPTMPPIQEAQPEAAQLSNRPLTPPLSAPLSAPFIDSNPAYTPAELVLNKYATTGIVVRVLGGNGDGASFSTNPNFLKFIPHEFGWATRGKPAISATYIRKDAPIYLASAGDIAFIYDSEKLFINQAFIVDAMSKQGRVPLRLSAGRKDESKIKKRVAPPGFRQIDYTWDKELNHIPTVDGISQKITRRLSKRNPVRLPHNELLIRRNGNEYDRTEMKDAIIGVIVRKTFLHDASVHGHIRKEIEKFNPFLPFFKYDPSIGELTELVNVSM